MELMSIGDFARASGLSHKALRLYDDSGLLAPVYVDPRSGYRFYDPAQLAAARLVGELRRVGMPLAQVAEVVRLPGHAAADAVAVFWAQVEQQTGARRAAATLLVDRLSRKDPVMTTTCAFRAAAACDPGLVRAEQQDAAHADGDASGPAAVPVGTAVLAVADGLGPAGAGASRAAVEALVAAARDGADAAAAGAAADAAAARAARPADGAGEATSGTTLTALVGGVLVHVGDSRAYVLRDGGLFLVSRDDSMVQDLVDAGRLTAGEARAHPQRALLTRVMPGHGAPAGAPPVMVRPVEVRPGDRWLLCTDGVSAVLDDAVVRVALAGAPDPADAVAALLDAVRAAGAPDNAAVVVADVTVDDGGTAVDGVAAG